jgi:uncharacterized membrane protein
MDSEDRIIQALKSLESESKTREESERIAQVIKDMFSRQSASMTFVTVLAMFAGVATAIYSAIKFFHATTVQDYVLFATLFLFGWMIVLVIRIWYMLRWARNSLMREIKRLELRLIVNDREKQS